MSLWLILIIELFINKLDVGFPRENFHGEVGFAMKDNTAGWPIEPELTCSTALSPKPAPPGEGSHLYFQVPNSVFRSFDDLRTQGFYTQ